MDSESEEVGIGQGTTGFFDGLSQAPKLSLKEKLLRSSIQQDSFLPNKQTSLQQKIDKHADTRIPLPHSTIFQEKVIVEQSDKPRKSVGKKPTLTLTEGNKGKSFEDLRLIRPLLKAVGELGYLRPTPIQQLAIPVISSGKDVVASSITGSGKTAAFLIPLIQRYFNVAAVGYIRSLIVTPTRELAIQIYE